MDGWSAPILVRELLEAYARGGSAASLPRVTPYRDYLAFIARQDRAAALAAWRESLAGLEEGTRLARAADAGRAAADAQPRRRAQAVAPERIELSLGGALSAGLNRTAREQALTLNTRAAGGLGHAARPAERARRRGVRGDGGGAAGGACRRRADGGAVHQHAAAADALPPQLPLSELLRQTQERQSRLMAHQHLGLAEIQQAAGLGELFDTLLVFENYPVDREGLAAASQRAAARPGRGPRCDALSAGADRAAGRGAAAAARLPARPVRARRRRSAGRSG